MYEFLCDEKAKKRLEANDQLLNGILLLILLFLILSLQ